MDQQFQLYQLVAERHAEMRRYAERQALLRLAMANQPPQATAGRLVRRALAAFGALLAGAGTALQSWAASPEVECRESLSSLTPEG